MILPRVQTKPISMAFKAVASICVLEKLVNSYADLMGMKRATFLGRPFAGLAILMATVRRMCTLELQGRSDPIAAASNFP